MDPALLKLPYRKGVLVYIFRKSELLLVTPDNAFWKIPSGGIEEGETPDAAVRREMREELGVDVEILKKCSFKSSHLWPEKFIRERMDYKGQEQVIFLARMKENAKIRNDPAEVKAFKWVPLDLAHTHLKTPNQRQMTKKAIEAYQEWRGQQLG